MLENIIAKFVIKQSFKQSLKTFNHLTSYLNVRKVGNKSQTRRKSHLA